VTRTPFHLLWVALLAGCAGATTGAGGSGPRPASGYGAPTAGAREAVTYRTSGTFRYLLVRDDTAAVELPDGTFRTTTAVRRVFLTVGLVPSGDGFLFDAVADSVRVDPAGAIPQPMVDSANGARWTGRMSSAGRLLDLTATRPSLVGQQIRSELYHLYAVLPAAGALPGAEWADTTKNPYRVNTFDATEQRVARYRAGDVESIAATRGLRIESQTEITLSGAGNQFGQLMDVTGTGTATTSHLLGLDGTLLGASGVEAVDMTLTVPALGQSVPAHTRGRFTLTRLP